MKDVRQAVDSLTCHNMCFEISELYADALIQKILGWPRVTQEG
jgi:hypothetical protein